MFQEACAQLVAKQAHLISSYICLILKHVVYTYTDQILNLVLHVVITADLQSGSSEEV